MGNRRYIIISIVLILVLVGIGYFNYASENNRLPALSSFSFKYGLDLKGGTELVYQADVSEVSNGDIKGAMETLRDVIERRVNIFGVSEPLIQVEDAGIISGSAEHRLIVELPGVTDLNKAIEIIGKTPTLEFKLENKDTEAVLLALSTSSATSTEALVEGAFDETGITGKYLKRAQLNFDQVSGEPLVSLQFNDDGKKLFADVTGKNIGKVLAIFLDHRLIEAPVIRQAIDSGEAQISGNMTPNEAKQLVRDLNFGALPLPITLVSSESIGPTLGEIALFAGIKAGVLGFILVSVFLIIWYRLPGVIAVLSLILYTTISLAIFKLIPVTLTAAGLAGFILSMGMAVDANILIFERMKEELRKGLNLGEAMHEGFRRAWLSIRDSNISSIITAIVLFWLGTPSVKGFALTLGLGVLVSMFTAITASRSFLFSTGIKGESKLSRFLFGSGINLKNNIPQP